MQAIAAVDQNWGIGKNGGMLFHLPEDLAFFRETTLGKTVVMGRETLLSLPGAQPLPGRENIILSRQRGLQVAGAQVCHSLPALFNLIAGLGPDDIYICGGHQVYRQLLAYCSAALVTKIFANGGATKYFPNLDAQPGWQLVRQGETHRQNGLEYAFCRYENSCVKIPEK